MTKIFNYVDNFFTSLTNYLTYNYIFLIFVGLFLFTIFLVLIFTSRSYESRLIKTIDKFNSYFIDNPQINEENLVAFNQKMKNKKVPKQLRKHWQQFVLYRENKASTYMSFENCVSNPIKNSSYTRDVKLMGTLAWILSACALILNCYHCYEATNIAVALSRILLTPIIILLLNWIVQIFLNLRHNAIVSDLFQNYQYFEVNIDKATETLPEYVDYEVLFDRNEIKKGIPILYTFLQKRAEEEQRQLERARLKNVEHEKFSFDDQGVAASLVLERALQEAENYIAERKKYTQDIGQINADITQEDMNYREITKEYNRQMQVSKETFANFKAQLEEVTSTIEANYLKKQQQQELDRQRNLERDFDTATEKHKKVIDSYQKELDTIDTFIAQSRKNLEDAMKSEFSTYNSKVYDEAKKLVEERLKDKFSKSKTNITDLEEKLVDKEQELEKAYNNNQIMSEKLDKLLTENKMLIEAGRKNRKFRREIMNITSGYDQQSLSNIQKLINENANNPSGAKTNKKEEDEDSDSSNGARSVDDGLDYQTNYNNAGSQNIATQNEYDVTDDYHNNEDQNYVDDQAEDQNYYNEDRLFDQAYTQSQQEYNQSPNMANENYNSSNGTYEEEYYDQPEGEDQQYYEDQDYLEDPNYQEDQYSDQNEYDQNDEFEDVYDGNQEFEEEQPAENYEYNQVEEDSTTDIDDSIESKPEQQGKMSSVVDKEVQVPRKRPGRPRKQKTEADNKPKRGRGRPRKVVSDAEKVAPKVKKGPGRPRKTETNMVSNVKRGPGRPKKVNSTEQTKATSEVKKGPGRPRKQNIENVSSIRDIDAYLKRLDAAIAAENAKLEKTQQELDKEAKLKRKK